MVYKMKYIATSLITAFFMFIATACTAGLADDLQDVSVTIKSGQSQGSGTLITRKIGRDNVTFVWTAGHVIYNLRVVRSVIKNGVEKKVVFYKDAQIVQEMQQDGRCVGEIKLEAKVIKASDTEYGEDLALLMVYRKNAYPLSASAKFIVKKDYVPNIGIKVVHVGSLLGQIGSNSFTSGLISQTGRTIEMESGVKRVFDQTTVIAFPGSSGGGVFLSDSGAYIGMLVRGAQQQGFHLIVPIRRMHKWAEDNDLEWAIDPSVKMPAFKELEKIEVE